MIFDSIGHLDRHHIPCRDEIVSFLKKNRPETLPVGEIEIRGRELFVRPAHYETKSAAQGKFETHRLYMDLQYVIEGEELMQVAPADVLLPLSEYNVNGDYQFFKASQGISSFIVRADEFAVFWPGEAHRPSCSVGEKPVFVKKLVFKIRIL
ncbi:MAG: YhcH/YjgK/YiaL family protein [Candidatus Omnitrophica bacterium]|nr:YhcH/YjgK/YiaL family protein [Candidatus Omnitrophota bacterium]